MTPLLAIPHVGSAVPAPSRAIDAPLCAATRRRGYLAQRLLGIDPEAEAVSDHSAADLPSLLVPGDLLVVNDAGTLPASLFVVDRRVEVRLCGRAGAAAWRALVLGAGDHRTPTERRPPPPRFAVGERLDFGELGATVESVDPLSPRVLVLRFDSDREAFLAAVYRRGRAIQYAHVEQPLELWDVQSPFASRPWAFEAPSAAFALTWSVLGALRERGIDVVSLTHAAGISSTGSDALDRRLPFPERYELPERTVDAIRTARRAGGRVVAVGTTTLRALESNAAAWPELRPGAGQATLVLGPQHRPRVVGGVLTGVHEPATSHFELLRAFAPERLLVRAHRHARAAGYLGHEFGDACLILAAKRTGLPRARGEG